MTKPKPKAAKKKAEPLHGHGPTTADEPSQCELCGKYRALVRCAGCGKVIAVKEPE